MVVPWVGVRADRLLGGSEASISTRLLLTTVYCEITAGFESSCSHHLPRLCLNVSVQLFVIYYAFEPSVGPRLWGDSQDTCEMFHSTATYTKASCLSDKSKFRVFAEQMCASRGVSRKGDCLPLLSSPLSNIGAFVGGFSFRGGALVELRDLSVRLVNALSTLSSRSSIVLFVNFVS